MTEHPSNHLIEIGDPTDDTISVPVAGPHVVIEYRDRGLPWMLVLPLLVTAAAIAVIGFKAFDNRIRPEVASESAPTPTIEANGSPFRTVPDPVPPSLLVTAPPTEIKPPVAPEPVPVAVNSAPEPGVSPMPPAPEVAIAPAVPEVVAAEPDPRTVSPFLPEDGAITAPPVVVAADPAAPAAALPPAGPALARAAEFGFDLQALERAEIKPDGPDGVRPAAAPPGMERLPEPGDANQPRTVDPKDLPKDPRQAQQERFQRFVAERKKLDEDRAKFHADLRGITRRFGKNAGPQIEDLCRRYGTDPDPVARAQAARLLNRAAAGVNQSVRINLLRSLGWPEGGILLLDIAETQGVHENGRERNGPRTREDVLCKSAMILLGCPPSTSTSATRSTPPSARAPGPSATAGRR